MSSKCWPNSSASCGTVRLVADDFGICRTSQGILELGERGLIYGTVLLANSPYAEWAVGRYVAAGEPLRLGWHPALTIDRPILSPKLVPTLVDGRGDFWTLRRFVERYVRGRIDLGDVRAEWAAQLRRFRELVGRSPPLVNAHHHIHLLPNLAVILAGLLANGDDRPMIRRVAGRGAFKHSLLAMASRTSESAWQGYPRNTHFGGVGVAIGEYGTRLRQWLAIRETRDGVSEWMCHPGHADATLAGRDGYDSACRRAEFEALMGIA